MTVTLERGASAMTPDSSKMLSAERLAELVPQLNSLIVDTPKDSYLRLWRRELLELLGHIKALESELAAARAPVEESEIAKVLELGAAMIRDPSIPVSLSPFLMVSRQIITRLARERVEARDKALEEIAALADKGAQDALHGGDAVGSCQPGTELRGFVSERLSDFADEIRALKGDA